MPSDDDRRRIAALLQFWFAGGDEPRDIWWRRDDAFDATLRERFGADCERAARGALDHWLKTPDGALALVLLLDQLPRNLHRGDKRAYACDAKARAATDAALARGHDRALSPVRRQFLYMPLQHSEDLADQKRCTALFATLDGLPDHEGTMRITRRHEEIIARFGRFPHRNAVLGRPTTAEEAAFLEEPNSSF
jgi:uncharacterized protein (DUF924 family)